MLGYLIFLTIFSTHSDGESTANIDCYLIYKKVNLLLQFKIDHYHFNLNVSLRAVFHHSGYLL